jgi:hypothetical protein
MKPEGWVDWVGGSRWKSLKVRAAKEKLWDKQGRLFSIING